MRQPSPVRIVAAIFSLKYLVKETYKGYDKETYLDQVRICNIHRHRPPFF